MNKRISHFIFPLALLYRKGHDFPDMSGNSTMGRYLFDKRRDLIGSLISTRKLLLLTKPKAAMKALVPHMELFLFPES